VGVPPGGGQATLVCGVGVWGLPMEPGGGGVLADDLGYGMADGGVTGNGKYDGKVVGGFSPKRSGRNRTGGGMAPPPLLPDPPALTPASFPNPLPSASFLFGFLWALPFFLPYV
jgi:hypothetical protein